MISNLGTKKGHFYCALTELYNPIDFHEFYERESFLYIQLYQERKSS